MIPSVCVLRSVRGVFIGGVNLNVVRFKKETHIMFSAIKHPIFNRTLLNIFDIPFLEVFNPKVDIWFMLILYRMHVTMGDSDLNLAEVT